MAASGLYRDRGDDYYETSEDIRMTRSKMRGPRKSRSLSRSDSRSVSRSASRSMSKSGSRSRSISESRARTKELNMRDPTFLDAFRVMYLRPQQTRSNTTKYLTVQKRQDRVKEALKQDGLGSKKWRFYPRPAPAADMETQSLPLTRETSDQRVKIDGNFFRKCKKNRKIDANSPVAKLKRWELLLYKKLGFVHAVEV